MENNQIHPFDERRNIAIPGDKNETLKFCVAHFIELASAAIQRRGVFFVALSGGSTPQAIFQGLAEEKHRQSLDWSRIQFFWSDERCVSPDDAQSNYGSAMKAGLDKIPIPSDQIHRMKGEIPPEEAAKEYEELIEKTLRGEPFDLVMLGMGDDGHTASLFPKTHGLHAPHRLVTANYVPKLSTWRITLTYSCMNAARDIAIYVLGKNKAETVKRVFSSPYDPDLYPIQKIGTPANHATWILDQEAASLLNHDNPNSDK